MSDPSSSGPSPRRSVSGIDLFSVAGIRIVVDYSWFIIFLLATWSLGAYFQQILPGTSTVIVYGWGAATALLLFVSVLLHELSHSLVARAKGIPVPRITLFIFGGVSQLGREPERPVDELQIAIAGPAASFVISMFCFLGYMLTAPLELEGIAALTSALAAINLTLAIFNLVPAFPLDGGRVLRAFLWLRNGSFSRSTVQAAFAGRVLALALIGLGAGTALLTGRLISLWWVLIGLFLHRAARASAQQATLRDALSGTRVEQLMSADVATLSRAASLQDAVETAFLVHRHSAYPVMNEHQVIGMLTLAAVKRYPQADWHRHTVQEAMRALRDGDATQPDELVTRSLDRMLQRGLDRMPVIEGGVLRGILSRRDIQNFLRIRSDLGKKPDR